MLLKNNQRLCSRAGRRQGLHNTEIGRRPQMTLSAVKSTLPQLFSKAEAKNRTRSIVANPSRCRLSAAT